MTQRASSGGALWAVHHVDQDGSGGGHIFPAETVDWRAAEYGLTDIDEILDVILHEPHLPDIVDRDDAALRAGWVTSYTAGAEPITLFTASSTSDAYAAHRIRIDDTKETRVLVAAPGRGRNQLDVIRRRGVDKASVRAKRELVDTHRWQLIYGALPVAPPPLIPASSTLEVPRA
ncbi:hypothetical protein ACFWPQ_01645 [Streptomyces sp. NPDC058464]|uniref:hypothetical protein n=1 Tax=Streptomyces sp. NPDC058464 TaxID=3346511 RepID=UPI003661F5F7